MSHSRLDQLSDGIFAIVMTILVFEIHLPDFHLYPTNSELWFALQTAIPSLLSFVLAFFLLFTYWRAHHFFISVYAKNVDLMLTNINAVFFMFISLIPLSTSLLGRLHESELPIIIFGVHIILIALTLYWMRSYVFYSEQIKNPTITKHEIRGSTIRTLVPAFVAGLAIALSFISVDASLILFMVAVLFNLSSISTRLFEKFLRLN